MGLIWFLNNKMVSSRWWGLFHASAFLEKENNFQPQAYLNLTPFFTRYFCLNDLTRLSVNCQSPLSTVTRCLKLPAWLLPEVLFIFRLWDAGLHVLAVLICKLTPKSWWAFSSMSVSRDRVQDWERKELPSHRLWVCLSSVVSRWGSLFAEMVCPTGKNNFL